MKIVLETHKYAPELNTAHIIRNGKCVAKFNVPNCTTIGSAREKLFPKCRLEGRKIYSVTVRYPENFSQLNRTHTFSAKTAFDALTALRSSNIPKPHKGGGVTLIDGRFLPNPSIRLIPHLWNRP